MNRSSANYETLWADCRSGAIRYVDSLRQDQPWEFIVSKAAHEPIALASAVAVLILAFVDALDDVPHQTRQSWLEYLQSFQRPDGLFEDAIDLAEGTQGHPYWALRAHRSRHIAWAIESLGGSLTHPIAFLEPHIGADRIDRWIENIWQENPDRIWAVGNWVMDMAVLLDLQARHFNDKAAAGTVENLLNALDTTQDPKTGFWMTEHNDTRSSMAGAMHLYPVYWAYGHKLNYLRQAVDTTLSLQQPDSLFGFDSGNGGSQCLDYDAMLILCNGYFAFDRRRSDIRTACSRVLEAIMINHNPDGSFADSQIAELRYWATKAAPYRADQGSLWDTYARLMTTAMCLEIVTGHPPEPMRGEHHLFEIFHAGRDWLNGKNP